jgi:multiple antibiotic resistance protein
MNEFLNTFLLVYAALFPIVNPIGTAPIFLGLTQSCEDAERNRLARAVAINSFFLLLGSVVVGSHVLEFFGISLPAVRVGGGLVVTAFGWKLLNSAPDSGGQTAARSAPMDDSDAFYPLTMPLTVGPGAISVAVTLGSQRPEHPSVADFLVAASGALVGLLAIAATVYLCFRFARRLVSSLGHEGTQVFVRLSAFILLCIGIQILWSGIKGLAHLS